MSNYGVRELTWENGQLTVQGLGELMQPNTSAKPIWTESLSGCQTLESVVHHAAQRSKLQSQDGPNHGSSREKKRPHSDVDLWLGLQEESLWLDQSVSASVSHHTYDARSLSCASYESCRSLKTARTEEKDYVRSGSDTQETEGEERETKCSRRGKAAAVHNESERRRRDRINQRMKTLQKLLPNGNKTDKVSILDDVIDHMKQLQAQIQFMSMRPNLPQQMMMMMMQPLPLQQQQQQFQMALLTTMAHMGMNGGGNAFVPPPPFTNTDCNNASSSFTITPPYSQTMTMDLYNKMAAAFYKQQSDQTT